MQKITLLTIVVFLFMQQLVAQENSFIDANSSKGNVIVPTNDQIYAPNDVPSACQYILDDGTQENSIGLINGGDFMWLNSFTANAGCELITSISVTWGQMPNGGTCRLILYEDPNDDGNPDDAVYLTETSTVVVNANTDIFTTVNITPTTVSGGFFVAALYQYQLPGDFPASLDVTSSLGNSWFCGQSTPGGIDVVDLLNNDLQPVLSDNVGFPGNLLLRCNATPPIPVSNWAIILGVLLIGTFIVVRYRRTLA